MVKDMRLHFAFTWGRALLLINFLNFFIIFVFNLFENVLHISLLMPTCVVLVLQVY